MSTKELRTSRGMSPKPLMEYMLPTLSGSRLVPLPVSWGCCDDFMSRFADSHKSQGNCYEKTSENHGEVPSNLVQEQKKCLELYSKQENLSARSPYLGFNDCALVTGKHSQGGPRIQL